MKKFAFLVSLLYKANPKWVRKRVAALWYLLATLSGSASVCRRVCLHAQWGEQVLWINFVIFKNASLLRLAFCPKLILEKVAINILFCFYFVTAVCHGKCWFSWLDSLVESSCSGQQRQKGGIKILQENFVNDDQHRVEFSAQYEWKIMSR